MMSIAAAFSLVASVQQRATDTIDVRMVTDEPDTVIALARTIARHEPIARDRLRHLSQTEGYRHLVERDTKFGGAPTDSAFAAFVTSLATSERIATYESARKALGGIDVAAAADRASAYLPRGTTLRARLYLEIKPRPNSFVFTGSDSLPSIFLVVQPGAAREQAMNTLTHELHHIGAGAACRRDPPLGNARVSASVLMLLQYLTAFGEGRAMLAAAGGPSMHPHAVDDDSIRARWDADVANASRDIAELSGFATAVLDGRITNPDSVERRGMSYFGVQGPWYSVGWLMAATVERVLGRPRLIATTCDPVGFLEAYNVAASRSGGGDALPTWPEQLLARLRSLRPNS